MSIASKLLKILHDDLYDSKDWRCGDICDRVEYLLEVIKSKSQEIDLLNNGTLLQECEAKET